MELGPSGVLFSFTTQHYVAPPPFRADPSLLPYTIVVVDLPEGLRVMGMLAEGCKPEDLSIGQPMALSSGLLRREEDRDVLTWTFRPAPSVGTV